MSVLKYYAVDLAISQKIPANLFSPTVSRISDDLVEGVPERSW
jgi:hypothetical protein